jgi:hypothetical protein
MAAPPRFPATALLATALVLLVALGGACTAGAGQPETSNPQAGDPAGHVPAGDEPAGDEPQETPAVGTRSRGTPAPADPTEEMARAASPETTASPQARGRDAGAPERIAYRVEVRTDDPATADFAQVVHDILTDPRGWVRAGFGFVVDPDAPYLIVLAEGPEVDELCLPMQTWSTYSCQNGPVVALNADRWREATPQWTGDLDDYRVMLVNHEVGHLLHLHHPTVHCPAPGLPAPVMAQQSTELGACLPNPWPLQWEVDLAAERREPLAPGPDHDPSDHRPTPPPVDR